MSIRNATAGQAVTEVVGHTGGADAVTETSLQCKAESAPEGRNYRLRVDVAVSNSTITYKDRHTADSPSKGEKRTARKHEFAHVGARKAFASQSILQQLCDAVQVRWTFPAPNPKDPKAQQVVDDTTDAYLAAVDDYVQGIFWYLDEYVVHEEQRKAKVSGVATDAEVNQKLADITYEDPDTHALRHPTFSNMNRAIAAARQGAAKTEAASGPTPPHVRPK